MKCIKYTKELLQEAVNNSNTISDIVKYLKVTHSGSSYRHIRESLKFFEIDISHFKFIPNLNKINRETLAEKILVLNRLGRREQAYILRRSMLILGFEEKCSECGIKDWNNKPIRLQVDHKNGNGLDNRPENLRFICPNCHTQTENYGSKNKNSIW